MTTSGIRKSGASTMPAKLGIAAAVLLALGYILFPRGGDVSGTEARRLVADGALLVDVRTPAEFADGHIPGAVNIPVQELGRRMEELGPRDKPVVLYCRSGNRSGQAASLLRRSGYTTVHNAGAMNQW